MADMFFEIPTTVIVKATGPNPLTVESVMRDMNYEDFAPDAFPLTRDGVTLELVIITFPGADDMAETEPDRY